MAKPWAAVRKTYAYQRARLIVLRRDPTCQLRRKNCTGISTEADHTPPLAVLYDQHGADTPEFRRAACDPNNMRGACAPCNRGDGGRLGGARRRARAPRPTPTNNRSRNW